MTGDELPPEPSGMHKAWTAIGEAVHDKIGPKITAARTAATTGMLDQIEADLVPLVRPIAEKMLADPNTPDELRPALEVLAGPEHFSGSIVISFAVGALLSPALGAALAPLVQVIANNAWALAPTSPLSPAVLAEMALKGVALGAAGVPGAGALAGEAALSGIDAGRFAAMTEAAGQALGPEQALLLWRRGQMSDAELDANLAYGNLNPKFYPFAKLLKFGPIPAGEVIAGNVKGHITDAEAATLLGHAGIDPANQPVLKAAAGRPIGIQEAVHLWKRGEITEARLTQIVQQSDVNDAFMPEVLLTGKYFPPPRSIVPMLRAGGITEAQARDLLAKQGVEEPWITAFVAEAHKTKTGTVKTLGEAQIVELYAARLITQADALARLEKLTYSAADAAELVALADEKRKVSLQNAALRKIGSEYVGRKITLAEATGAMSSAGIPTLAQHDAVTYWDVERTVNVHKPSPAQVVGAYRRGDIGAADCKLRLQQLGIADADIGIFVADGYPPTKGAEARAAAAAVLGA